MAALVFWDKFVNISLFLMCTDQHDSNHLFVVCNYLSGSNISLLLTRFITHPITPSLNPSGCHHYSLWQGLLPTLSPPLSTHQGATIYYPPYHPLSQPIRVPPLQLRLIGLNPSIYMVMFGHHHRTSLHPWGKWKMKSPQPSQCNCYS